MTSVTPVGFAAVANVVVPVDDQDAALVFYRDGLGLEVRIDVPMGQGRRWIEVAPAGATTTIGLAVPFGGMWRTVGGDSNISLATTDVVGMHARLQADGVDVDAQVLRLPGGAPPLFRLRDPFGNVLQVVEHNAGGPRRRGGRGGT